MKTFVHVTLFLSLFAARSNADIIINEILLEPSGDNFGQQLFEISGMANASLDGLALLAIDGGVFSGEVYEAIDLTGLSLGPNGLLLMRDFTTATFPDVRALLPAPDPLTPMEEFGAPLFEVNISQTFALVSNFTGFVFEDLDTNDDGILDLAPWDNVVDAIGIRENDGTPADEFAFGTQLGFQDFPVVGFEPDAIFRDGASQAWYASDVTNPNAGGPFAIDRNQFVDVNGVSQSAQPFSINLISPGNVNATAIPEPHYGATILLLTILLRLRIVQRGHLASTFDREAGTQKCSV